MTKHAHRVSGDVVGVDAESVGAYLPIGGIAWPRSPKSLLPRGTTPWAGLGTKGRGKTNDGKMFLAGTGAEILVVAQRPTVLFVSLRITAVTHPPPSVQIRIPRVCKHQDKILASFSNERGTRGELSIIPFLLWLLSASVGIRLSVVLIFHVGDISARFAPVYPITISMRRCIRLVRLSEAVVHKST